jgi:mersacidin/lichenicidin family type 2 lantibiotic
MSYQKIIRAWKDLEYRLSLSEAERALLPDHPAGVLVVPEEELHMLAGASAAACGTIGTTGATLSTPWWDVF